MCSDWCPGTKSERGLKLKNVLEALDAEYLTFGFSVLCFTTGWATMASYVASGQIVNKNRTSEYLWTIKT